MPFVGIVLVVVIAMMGGLLVSFRMGRRVWFDRTRLFGMHRHHLLVRLKLAVTSIGFALRRRRGLHNRVHVLDWRQLRRCAVSFLRHALGCGIGMRTLDLRLGSCPVDTAFVMHCMAHIHRRHPRRLHCTLDLLRLVLPERLVLLVLLERIVRSLLHLVHLLCLVLH